MNTDLLRRDEQARGVAPAGVYTVPAPDREPEPSFWQAVQRHKLLLGGCVAACTLAAMVASRLQTPLYQASTALEIQGWNENFLKIGEVDPIARASDTASDVYLQTQIQVLRSRALVGRVVSRLGLEKRAEYQRAGMLESWRGAGTPLSVRERALNRAADSLTVTAQRGARIARIEYEASEPRLASDFANTLAQEFIEQNLELRLAATRHTGEWLTRQLEDLRMKLRRSEDQLHAYARAAGLLFTTESSNAAVDKLRQLQEELSRVQAERIARQSRYELAARARPDSLPDVLDAPALREYQMRLTELQRQLAEQRSLLTPTHYKVRRIQAQVTELEAALAGERNNIVARIANEYEAARRREQLLEAAYAGQANLVGEQGARAVHYNILKREVDTNRQLYETMLQRVKEASVASAMRASNIVVVDPAEPPSRPYRPNLLLNGAVGLLAGLLLGVALLLARDRADHSLKEPGETTLYLQVPELGVIPSRQGRSKVEIISLERKPSLLAESFQATLASILFAGDHGAPPQVIVLTSPNPREGKTTALSNLGIVLARIRPPVLMIDGDMRHPRLHEVFGTRRTPGLSDLLRQTQPLPAVALADTVRGTAAPGLCVLASGSDHATPSELLHSPRLAELLAQCRANYGTVLIDAPPVLPLVDARLLGRLADAVVLVCRAGETDRRSAAAAADRLAADGATVLGAILNDWDPRGGGYHKYSSSYRKVA
jgi:capsular exopolysaccharide synthesis family protein